MSTNPKIPRPAQTNVRLGVVRPSEISTSSTNTQSAPSHEASKAKYEAKLLAIYSKVFQKQEEDQALLERAKHTHRYGHPYFLELILIFIAKIINDSERSSSDIYKLIFTGAAIAITLLGILFLFQHYLFH